MIDLFKDDYQFLSNFYDCPVTYAGVVYQNSESAYQAAKFVTDVRHQFVKLSGAEAKSLARTYKGFVRADWKDINLGIMAEIVHAKFTQNKDLRIKLLNTYPQQLTEGNWWHDTFWGVCTGKCRQPHPEPTGLNWLGRMLMAERAYWLDLMVNRDYYEQDRLVTKFLERQKAA
jgi:ribA/ribD-fused uncharacterized protein